MGNKNSIHFSTDKNKLITHLLYLTSSETPVGCNGLLHPKYFLLCIVILFLTTSFDNQLPLIIIPFKGTVILQKRVHNLPPQFVHLGQTLDRRAPLPCIFVPFGMQAVDQLFEFIDICLLAQTSAPRMLAVTISRRLLFLFGASIAIIQRTALGRYFEGVTFVHGILY